MASCVCSLQPASLEMSATRFISASSCAQQREPVVAQHRLVGHHHHLVEEGIDRIAHAGQRAQRLGVVLIVRQRSDRAARAPRSPRTDCARRPPGTAQDRARVCVTLVFLRILRMRLLAAARLSASGMARNACTASRRGTTWSMRVGFWLTTASISSWREAALAQIVAQAIQHEQRADRPRRCRSARRVRR